MKFIYGKQDWKTFERGEENCYLMANGLGGFSSLTMIGSCGRNDHAVLMACTHSPNHRYNMIHRLEEAIRIGEETMHISSQDYQAQGFREEGYLYQSSFSFEDFPQWAYHVKGMEIIRTIALMPGENTIGISYHIRNRSGKDATLEVLPHLQFVPKGTLLSREQQFTMEGQKICSNGQMLYFRTNGEATPLPLAFSEELYYAYDACDGRRENGRTAVNHKITLHIPASLAEGRLELVYGTSPLLPSMEDILAALRQYRNALKERAAFPVETAQTLALAANQFISFRASTGKQTILAGFPFFEDWGRDTMIAIVGCCLATRQYETAVSILETFMAYCSKGLMPNLFPEGKEAPGYNTVDAALLFIIAVYEYYRRTNDIGFVRRAYPTMAEIIGWYIRGTDYAIRMDADGLILAGEGLDQVTWMDVRVGDILPTPRHGKPVEINAYWYNALRIMEEFQPLCAKTLADGYLVDDYPKLAEQARESFQKQFWNTEAGCLKDVLSGTKADAQIRCNQIWAVSLPFSVLTPEQENQVVETVFQKLYTPYGLRTLDPADGEFHPAYGGAQLDRDLAYHQGTVWTFPLGGYYLAYLKVHGYSDTAKAYVKGQLEYLRPALREGCIGQLPEIYDGGNPTSSRGCFAQAWSVGEILRVYDALR